MTTDQLRGIRAVQDLVYQLYETELVGVQVYRAAFEAVNHAKVQEEWQRYLTETEQHVEVARSIVVALGLDPDRDIPARNFVRRIGQALLANIREALSSGDRSAAELAAAEAIVYMETKDHFNWELLRCVPTQQAADLAKVIDQAIHDVEPQEARHLYYTRASLRELWSGALRAT